MGDETKISPSYNKKNCVVENKDFFWCFSFPNFCLISLTPNVEVFKTMKKFFDNGEKRKEKIMIYDIHSGKILYCV